MFAYLNLEVYNSNGICKKKIGRFRNHNLKILKILFLKINKVIIKYLEFILNNIELILILIILDQILKKCNLIHR